jgi:hypothetical protein
MSGDEVEGTEVEDGTPADDAPEADAEGSPEADASDADRPETESAEAESTQPRPGEPRGEPPPPPVPPGPPPSEDGNPISTIPLEPPPESVPRPRAVPPPTTLPKAVIQDVEPDHGVTLGGDKVTLRGENLFRESIVRIGGSIAATVGASEPREIEVSTPPRPGPGPVDVSVQNPGAELVTLDKAFRYESLPAPTIETVAPNRVAAKGGTEISITGTGFVDQTVVVLDGAAVPTKFVDASTLEVTVPAGQDGRMVDVAVANPDGKQDVEVRAFVYDERFD